MTDPAIITASYAAERNYTHNPDDVIDPSGAVGAWGTAKESTDELVDLSGNNNIATIHGAMPIEGFIQGRRFTAANEDYLDCGNDSSLQSITTNLDCIFMRNNNSEYEYVFDARQNGGEGYINLDNSPIFYINSGTAYVNGIKTTNIEPLVYNHVHIDGISINAINKMYLGIKNNLTQPLNGFLCFFILHDGESFFNIFARLPFWSVNYTDYPDNVAEYTDNLPYSSSIISSGTFKVDADVLDCVSAGTMTYSASYTFDGSEYIKVTIDGIEYAGTGTITQGNTTVSVAQGSNKVTIVMGTGDTIEGEIGIQFREEV